MTPIEDEVPNLIQYRDPLTQSRRSVVLCRTHEATLLRALKRTDTGCLGCQAGSLSRCDWCEDGQR
jgi:hypothetical protein